MALFFPNHHKVTAVPYLYGMFDPYTGKYWNGEYSLVDNLNDCFLTSKIPPLLVAWHGQAVNAGQQCVEFVMARSRMVVVEVSVHYTGQSPAPDDPFNNPSHVANMGNLMTAITGGFGLEVASLTLHAIQKFPNYPNLCFSSSSNRYPIKETLPQLCVDIDSYFRIISNYGVNEIVLLPDDATMSQLLLALPEPMPGTGGWVAIDLTSPIPYDTLDLITCHLKSHLKNSYLTGWLDTSTSI